MKVVYLPGFSTKNLHDGEVITEALKELNYDVYFHHWSHWKDHTLEFKPHHEVTRIAENFDPAEDITLIGKSIGTHISVRLLNNYQLKVNKLILMGLPFTDMDEENKNEYRIVLRSVDFPVFIIQNRDDPFGSERLVRETLGDIDAVTIIKDGDHHRYVYPEDVLQILEVNK